MKNVFLLLILAFELQSQFIFSQIKDVHNLKSELNKERRQDKKVDLFIALGDYYKYNNTDSSIYWYDKGYELAESLNLNDKLAICLKSLGNVYLNIGEYDKSFSYLNKGLEFSEKGKNKKITADINANLGNYFLQTNQYDDAKRKFEYALSIYNEIDDKKGAAGILSNLGIYESFLGNDSLAKHFFKKSIDNCIQIDDKKGISNGYNNLGVIYANKSDYDSAIICYEITYSIDKEAGDDISASLNNLGNAYYFKGDFYKALEFFHKSLDYREKLNDKVGMAACYKNIGVIHSELGDNKKALEYYLKSKEINELIGNNRGLSGSYNNIGTIYLEEKKYDEAQKQFEQAYSISKQINDMKGMAESLCNISNVYDGKGNKVLAIEYLNKALEIDKELGDIESMSILYSNLAGLNIDLRNYKDALKNANIGLTLAKEIGSLTHQKEAHEILALAFENINDYNNAYSQYKKFKAINDSIFKESTTKNIKELEAKYQNEKKQKEIEIQKERMRKLTFEKYALIIGLILVFILVLISYNSFKQKKKANILLTTQKVEIEIKNKELAEQNEEIKSQRDEIETQLDLLAIQNKDITDSIYYARFIQQALLTSVEVIENSNLKSFILYLPRDIVSGDFYWFKKIKNYLYFTAADCTGHGVPGAFMSVLGISLLNEIVGKRDLNPPAQILDELRKRIKKSLKQDKVSNEIGDGMDMAFCLYDTETKKLRFSGANSPLIIIRENNIVEYKADRMPIGIHPKDSISFTNYEIQLEKDDTIYIFSDGYFSQFGGVEGKRFTIKRFKELLLEVSQNPVNYQEQILEDKLHAWQNGKEQIDDILVVGIRVA